MEDKYVCKIQLDKDLRRVVLPSPSFGSLLAAINQQFRAWNVASVVYNDDENEWITVASDEEVREAFQVAKRTNRILKFVINNGTPAHGSPTVERNQTTPSQPQNANSTPMMTINPAELMQNIMSGVNTFAPLVAQGLSSTLNASNNNATTTNNNNNNNNNNVASNNANQINPQAMFTLLQSLMPVYQTVSSLSSAANQLSQNASSTLNNLNQTAQSATSQLPNPNVNDISATLTSVAQVVQQAVQEGATKLMHVMEEAKPTTTTEVSKESSTSEMVVEKEQKVEEKKPLVMHQATCDYCMKRINGIRYKCGNCADYDLCEACEKLENVHNEDHVFIKVKKPTTFTVSRALLPNFYRNNNNASSNEPIIINVDCNNNAGSVKPIEISIVKEPTVVRADSEKILLASFVADETIPDGTELEADTPFVKSWRLRNDGLTSWPAKTQLVFVSGSPEIQLKSKEGMHVGSVAAGQEISVSIPMVSPPRVGRFASYFRLVNPEDGQQFGHRIWVDIIVIPKKPVAPVSPVVVVEEQPVVVPMPIDVEENNNNNNKSSSSSPVVTAVVEEQQQQQPAAAPVELKTVGELADALQKMEELGFTNTQHNMQVLYKHGGDVVQAVIELLDQQN